jgi:hypothetical protein
MNKLMCDHSNPELKELVNMADGRRQAFQGTGDFNLLGNCIMLLRSAIAVHAKHVNGVTT